jgi:diacylglycerol kinase (ATP)
LFEYDILFTQYTGHGRELSKMAVKENMDAVVVVGGDGSINEVGSALVNSEVGLGIIPSGSGNGLAHHLNLPFNLGKSIQSINAFRTQKIDTLEINGHFGVNVSGVGFDARIAQEFAKVRRRGFWSYFQIVLREFPKYIPQVYKIITDEQQIERDALLVCFANSSQFGNGVVIAPQAQINDGKMEVCIVSRVPILEAPFLGQMMISRLINRTHYVQYIKTNEVTVIQSRDHFAHIDGEFISLGKDIHVKVNSLSLNVIL